MVISFSLHYGILASACLFLAAWPVWVASLLLLNKTLGKWLEKRAEKKEGEEIMEWHAARGLKVLSFDD